MNSPMTRWALDDLSALGFHFVDRRPHDRSYLGILWFGPEEICQHTDADAAQTGELQKIGIGIRGIADAGSGLRVGGIVADDCIEHDCDVGYGAPDRPADVLGAGERDYPVAAGQSLRPPDSHQTVMGCWNADRAASVAAHADRGHELPVPEVFAGSGGEGAMKRPLTRSLPLATSPRWGEVNGRRPSSPSPLAGEGRGEGFR